MRIITSGAGFLDIDAFAGCVGYAELLKLQDIAAYPVSTAPWNQSITPTVRSWGAPLLAKYTATPSDTFTLIDISDAAHFDPIVAVERVDEIIDHHPGFEQYWKERLGDRAHIEFIGAACTLVYERWQAAGKTDHMSPVTAGLLATGIVENTLNFTARVTTARDKQAYADLLQRTDLTETWPGQYFSECQDAIVQDLPAALSTDTKIVTFNGFTGEIGVGQLAVWDGPAVLSQHLPALRNYLSALRPNWFANVISIGEATSYLVSDQPAVQTWLAGLLDLKFENGVARAGRPWLRKEIIKQTQA